MPRRTNINSPGKMLFKLSNAIYNTPKFTAGSNVTVSINETGNGTGNGTEVITTPGPAILLPGNVTTLFSS